MTATAAIPLPAITIERAGPDAPILRAAGRNTLGIRAGTVITMDGQRHAFHNGAIVNLPDLAPGTDYAVSVDAAGAPYAVSASEANPLTAGYFAGFHYASGGNATARNGGDTVPAVNPYSLWDAAFRPAAPDPRGMTMIEVGSRRVWVDIYLLGIDHHLHGTSRFLAEIADGRNLPYQPDGNHRFNRLDYATAEAIYAHHGKRLLGIEEFFAAAYGVMERCSRSVEPERTGELTDNAARFISQRGVFDATGSMWQRGTDGDPDSPRPSLFGGSWFNGVLAGSRRADLGDWPGGSSENFGARGASDHLTPA